MAWRRSACGLALLARAIWNTWLCRFFCQFFRQNGIPCPERQRRTENGTVVIRFLDCPGRDQGGGEMLRAIAATALQYWSALGKDRFWMVPAIALTIGGSDSGGGAGIQADLKTFSALQVHGCSALSCITAQNTCGVSRVDALPPEALRAQVEAVCSDLAVAALKTGMLLNRALIEAAAEAIAPLAIPRLIDPVMVSRAGAVLLEPEAIEAYRRCLLPLAELITPNVHEARLLSGLPIAAAADVERAAETLLDTGAVAVLIKGGGLPALRGRDYLQTRAAAGEWLVSAAVDTPHTHGSGCTLAAAITAFRARGLELAEALRQAKLYVDGALRHALAIGSGQGPLCHWHLQAAPWLGNLRD